MRDGWRQVTLGDLLHRRTDFTAVDPDASYSILGIQRSGWGFVEREPILGADQKFTKLMKLAKDDVVYRTITAFEAPSAVAGGAEAGKFVTPQTFPTFRIDRSALLPEYMQALTTWPSFHEEMSTRCTGSVLRRKTLSIAAFESIPVELPPLDEQRRIVDLIGTLDDAIEAARESSSRLATFAHVFRESRMWSDAERTTLDDLCRVDGSLVSPVGDLADLPHVGAERITSGTGELVGVVTAAQDGVTSGKYRFDGRHVIYSKIRPQLRKVAVPEFAGLCSADAYPLLPNDGIPRRYLQQLLLTDAFSEVATSRSGRTKMPKINRSELMSIEVPQHDQATMSKLAEWLESLSRARRAMDAQAERLRGLRSNLLTALLSGEHEIPSSYDEMLEAS